MEKGNRATAQQTKVTGEINSGEVVTIPNMAVSVRNLLINHTRGHALPTGKAEFGGEQPIIKDLTELEDWAELAEERKKEALEKEYSLQNELKAKKEAEKLRKEKEIEFENFLQKQKAPE